MTKFVEVPIGERKNPSKKEYKTFEVFALNRDEAITHLKDGYTDPLYMPPQLTGLLFAWIFFGWFPFYRRDNGGFIFFVFLVIIFFK